LSRILRDSPSAVRAGVSVAVRDDVDCKAIELRLPHFAVSYFGTMPENTALVL
jgi:hypothetical protein